VPTASPCRRPYSYADGFGCADGQVASPDARIARRRCADGGRRHSLCRRLLLLCRRLGAVGPSSACCSDYFFTFEKICHDHEILFDQQHELHMQFIDPEITKEKFPGIKKRTKN
jgi:hypothetical protein